VNKASRALLVLMVLAVLGVLLDLLVYLDLSERWEQRVRPEDQAPVAHLVRKGRSGRPVLRDDLASRAYLESEGVPEHLVDRVRRAKMVYRANQVR
jgi:hypothetical protein